MFDFTQFNLLLLQANNRFSKIMESSMAPIQQQLAGVRGFIPPLKLQQTQELVFNLPYEKQQRYAAALKYIEDKSSIVICGKPVKPVMEFTRFDAGDFSYAAITDTGLPVHSSAYPGATPLNSYHHVFDFKFKSSTGNLESLRKVKTREHVKFRTPPGGPPFNANVADTPIEFYWGETTESSSGYGRDDHMTKPPALVVQFPESAGELVADQWYQYSIDKGASWKNIEGAAYSLIKGVRKGGDGNWYFYFAKKNWLPHNTVSFHFEAEYRLLPPNPAPAPGSKLMRANGTVANINDYGRLVRMK